MKFFRFSTDTATRYCYAYAYGEQVILLSDTVIFLNSGQRCDIAPL